MGRLKVIKEDEKGLNLKFKDKKTNQKITRKEVIENIKKGGKYSEEYIVVNPKDKRIHIKSKPNGSKKDNLG